MKTKTTLLLALAALLLAPASGCTAGDDQDAGSGSGAVAAETGTTEVAGDEGEGGGSGRDASGGEASLAQVELPAIDEKVIRTATLDLVVRPDGFQAAVDRARSIAIGHGGYVVSSESAQSRYGRIVQGSMVVRVPGRAYAQAMQSLSRLGRVEGTTEASTSVSAEYVDLESRARHLQAVEQQLLSFLRRADSVTEALAVQSRLNEVQLELEQVRGRLRLLDDQTAYATISLTLRERGAAEAADDDDWGVVDAWEDGAKAFVGVAGRAFVVIAGGAPLILLALAAFLAYRVVRRRSLPAA